MEGAGRPSDPKEPARQSEGAGEAIRRGRPSDPKGPRPKGPGDPKGPARRSERAGRRSEATKRAGDPKGRRGQVIRRAWPGNLKGLGKRSKATERASDPKGLAKPGDPKGPARRSEGTSQAIRRGRGRRGQVIRRARPGDPKATKRAGDPKGRPGQVIRSGQPGDPKEPAQPFWIPGRIPWIAKSWRVVKIPSLGQARNRLCFPL